ncbi:22775_t:CDS:2, partial [Gigaspora rosea]
RQEKAKTRPTTTTTKSGDFSLPPSVAVASLPEQTDKVSAINAQLISHENQKPIQAKSASPQMVQQLKMKMEIESILTNIPHAKNGNSKTTLKQANKIYRMLSHLPIPLSYHQICSEINKCLLMIRKKAEYFIAPIDATVLQPKNILQFRTEVKHIKKALQSARDLENNREKKEKIQYYIDRRERLFAKNTKKMINSVLHCNNTPAIFNNIRKKDSIITGAKGIKEAIQSHFEQWTQYNPPATLLWRDWQDEYTPKIEIDTNWYIQLNDKIEMDELRKVIVGSPNKKAAGPDGITNELLKQLPEPAIEAILQIFNTRLKLGKTLKTWKHSLVWPIANIKVPRSIKARLIMNTTNDNKSNPIATWTIEDMPYMLSTREKTWPSIMKVALTAVITLSIVIPRKTELVIETDIMYIKQVVDNYVNKNIQSTQIIDRHDLANHIICILVITNHRRIQIKTRVKKDIEKSAADRIYTIDLKAQELLQDVHILQLQNESIPYNPKTVVKYTFQAAEYSEWYCQNRVMQMNNKGIIDWQKTYDYINYDYRPMTRYTHAAKLKLKTFKIKILTNELLHLLNLHHKVPANYPNPTCPKCTKEVEDEKHWLRCKANAIKLSTIIEEVLDENSKKKKFTKAQTKKYIEEFEQNYIRPNSKLRIGLFSKKIKTPYQPVQNNNKLDVEITHKITEKIYKEIWVTSRQQIQQLNNNIKLAILPQPTHGENKEKIDLLLALWQSTKN